MIGMQAFSVFLSPLHLTFCCLRGHLSPPVVGALGVVPDDDVVPGRGRRHF